MIHLFSPLFYVDECLEGIRECLEKGWAGPGEKSAEFEREWRTYTGYEYSVFLNSANQILIGKGGQILAGGFSSCSAPFCPY